jgi:hypothetical protein
VIVHDAGVKIVVVDEELLDPSLLIIVGEATGGL